MFVVSLRLCVEAVPRVQVRAACHSWRRCNCCARS